MSDRQKSELHELAHPSKRRGLFGELIDHMRESKKWWLIPILLVLGLIGGLAVLGGGAAAPFIYTLF